MISLHKCSDLSSIRDLKLQYIEGLVAPMDGMWEVGFIDPSAHWEIRCEGVRAGYYAANKEGALLQFHLLTAFEDQARLIFEVVTAQESLERAVVSTIDPLYLSLCLDLSHKPAVHTFLYETNLPVEHGLIRTDEAELRPIHAQELKRTVEFQIACLGGETELKDWLRGYSSNLIARKELYVLSRNDEWLGLGEHRVSDSQVGIVDLGMMVEPEHRSCGWATDILLRLRSLCDQRQMTAICSTTVDNESAQKSIQRAGFVSRHRILNVVL